MEEMLDILNDIRLFVILTFLTNYVIVLLLAFKNK